MPSSRKRLIVCCDGTWLNSDNGLLNGEIAVPSNVTRISRAIKPISSDGIPQVVYYHFGVGGGGSFYDKLIGGSTGEGLADNIRAGYSFLCTNYAPGDEIFLIGFSRGAFTARSIGGLIDQVGILTKAGLPSLVEVYSDVKHRRDPNYRPKNPDQPFPNKPSAADPQYADEMERLGLTHLNVGIKAVAVWDTVGSLGIPRLRSLVKIGAQSVQSKETAFYDTKLSNCIENAFQALALDEKRTAFTPAVWEKPKGNTTTLRQVWFPGTHSNVGGGYDDQQLANITLAWMMAQLDPFLDLDKEYVLEQDEENEAYYRARGMKDRPWSFGRLYNSVTGFYTIGGKTDRQPGQYHAVNPQTGRVEPRVLRDTHEYIHASARTRLCLKGPGLDDKGVWEPASLMKDWRVDVVTEDSTKKASSDTKSSRPVVLWRRITRPRRGQPDTLPEAPLWGIEKRLLSRTDVKTWRYVNDPSTRRHRRRASEGAPTEYLSPSSGHETGGGGPRSPRRKRAASLGNSSVAQDDGYGADRERLRDRSRPASARAPSRSVRGGGEGRYSVERVGSERAPSRAASRRTATVVEPGEERVTRESILVKSPVARPRSVQVVDEDGFVLEKRGSGHMRRVSAGARGGRQTLYDN